LDNEVIDATALEHEETSTNVEPNIEPDKSPHTAESSNLRVTVEEPSSERYSFRNRSEMQERTTFNDDFNNPSNSSKSYSQQTHVQLFQHSITNMIKRPKRLRDHISSLYKYATHFIFNQMTANKGIKKHGQSAVDALYKEFAQLDAKGVFQPISFPKEIGFTSHKSN
jgi:hypothetical protein